ncbi:hypothetical protein AKJ16_DCAP14226 [Drosera capensis]
MGKEIFEGCCESDILEELGCTLVHEVDVHTMSKHPCLETRFFDKVVFNFPHAGWLSYYWIREHDASQMRSPCIGKLVSGFFETTKNMLTENGEIHR